MKKNAEIERGRMARGLAAGLILLFLGAGRLAAEDSAAVGLEARGVDVRAALRGDLDVRDASNRPVSRALIERQLAGGAETADPGAAMSHLPFAGALWHVLSRILWGLGLRGGLPGPSGPGETAWPLPEPKAPPPSIGLAVIAICCLSTRALKARAVLAIQPSFPPVLRC